MNENENIMAPENSGAQNGKAENERVEIIGVTFRNAGKIYYFDANGIKVNEKRHVIVDTARGYEYGKVALSNRMVPVSELVLPLRKVLRVADKNDDMRYKANCEKEDEAFEICQKMIRNHGLDMKLIDVEYTFDNAKLLFYFTSEERVDFRELVKDLASVFRTRIELRQIGLRDETKIIGGYGICGREFCCHSFLGDFVQVSIKMAKEQNLSLNSSKISGACGRLMCCLRYEHDTYQEEIKKNPKIDSYVITPDGPGTVVDVQTLAGLVKVRLEKDPEGTPVIYDRGLLRNKNGEFFVPGDRSSVTVAQSDKNGEIQTSQSLNSTSEVQDKTQEAQETAEKSESAVKHKNNKSRNKKKHKNKSSDKNEHGKNQEGSNAQSTEKPNAPGKHEKKHGNKNESSSVSSSKSEQSSESKSAECADSEKKEKSGKKHYYGRNGRRRKSGNKGSSEGTAGNGKASS